MRPLAPLTEAFRRHGMKVTPQRDLVCHLLDGNTTHPTAESLWGSARSVMPTFSLKTVYQVLHDLSDLGAVTILDVGTGSHRFDPNVGVHHHLVCTGCAALHDLDLDLAGLEIPEAKCHGFRIDAMDVVLRGLCPACV